MKAQPLSAPSSQRNPDEPHWRCMEDDPIVFPIPPSSGNNDYCHDIQPPPIVPSPAIGVRIPGPFFYFHAQTSPRAPRTDVWMSHWRSRKLPLEKTTGIVLAPDDGGNCEGQLSHRARTDLQCSIQGQHKSKAHSSRRSRTRP